MIIYVHTEETTLKVTKKIIRSPTVQPFENSVESKIPRYNTVGPKYRKGVEVQYRAHFSLTEDLNTSTSDYNWITEIAGS